MEYTTPWRSPSGVLGLFFARSEPNVIIFEVLKTRIPYHYLHENMVDVLLFAFLLTISVSADVSNGLAIVRRSIALDEEQFYHRPISIACILLPDDESRGFEI